MTDNMNYQEKLSEIRKKIDAVDNQLIPLFIERMKCSEEVAEVKRAASMPVLNVQREQEILEKVKERAGEYGSSVAAIYSAMMAVSRARQHQLLVGGSELRELEANAKRQVPLENVRVSCQGVEGAYSHKAASAFFKDAQLSFYRSWEEVFEAIAEDRTDFGVLPVENSAAGSVSGVYDLMLKYRFFIVGAVDVKVEHCLAALSSMDKIKKVISHPQGLSQCSDFIRAHDLSAAEYSNTAAAAKFIAEEKAEDTAAICSEDAASKYGLTVLEKGIQNAKNNTTRFVVISKEPILPDNAEKISLCFSLPHVTGSLYSILERFSISGLNLTKIESRPIPGSEFEYDFYLDFTGNIHKLQVLELICALHDELPRFSFLGNYPELK